MVGYLPRGQFASEYAPMHLRAPCKHRKITVCQIYPSTFRFSVCVAQQAERIISPVVGGTPCPTSRRPSARCSCRRRARARRGVGRWPARHYLPQPVHLSTALRHWQIIAKSSKQVIHGKPSSFNTYYSTITRSDTSRSLCSRVTQRREDYYQPPQHN